MNKLQHLIISGFLLIAAGISMFFIEDLGLGSTKAIISLLFFVAGVLSITFATSNKKLKVPYYFQFIQGAGLSIYAIAIWFISADLAQFLITTTYFIMAYGFIEFLFPFSILNSSTKVIVRPMIFRFVSGLSTILGATFLLLATLDNEMFGMNMLGGLTCLIGISNVLFAVKVKKINPNDFIQ